MQRRAKNLSRILQLFSPMNKVSLLALSWTLEKKYSLVSCGFDFYAKRHLSARIVFLRWKLNPIFTIRIFSCVHVIMRVCARKTKNVQDSVSTPHDVTNAHTSSSRIRLSYFSSTKLRVSGLVRTDCGVKY